MLENLKPTLTKIQTMMALNTKLFLALNYIYLYPSAGVYSKWAPKLVKYFVLIFQYLDGTCGHEEITILCRSIKYKKLRM